MKNTVVYQTLIFLAIFSLYQQNNLNAQGTLYVIKEKKIPFKNKVVDIPQVYSIAGEDTANISSINEKIIKKFTLIPNAPKNEADYDAFVGELEFFKDFAGYLDIKYSYQSKSNFIEITIEGNYVEFEGKPAFEIYQIYKEETFYLDIESNELFSATGYDNEIKLKYFFEPKEYIELLSKTWVPRIEQIKKKYPDNIECEYACEDCSSSNASLHSFGYEYEIEKDSLYFSLNSVAYFRDFCYRDFCSSQLKVVCPIESITQLFKKDFDALRYSQLDRLSKIVFYKKHLENNLREARIISGKIDGKYPFLMALNIKEDENKISGHYMYTSNRRFLTLKGSLIGDKSFEVIEYLNDKSTGKFEFKYKGDVVSQYDIKHFKWHSSDGKKSYKVEVDDFEIY